MEQYALGYVDNPAPEHEQHRGKLAIPYLRTNATGIYCASIRFRCIEHHDHEGHGKYATVAGDQPWLFNTKALSGGDVVGIAEGEIDAITASLCGLPTVGVPGTQAWGDQWHRLFEGFSHIYLFVDGDEPGRKFARELGYVLGNIKPIEFGDGHDVNSFVLENGTDAFRRKVIG